MTTAVHVSGWCQVAPGTVHTRRQHEACRSLCECADFGGHGSAQNPAVERDSASYMGATSAVICDNGENDKCPTAALTTMGRDRLVRSRS